MPIVFVLISAAAYGVSDFLGGIFARRATAWQVAVVGQTSSTLTAFTYFFFLGGAPVGSDVMWAIAAGLSLSVGVVFLYRGLAAGYMSVVAPVSAVGSALLPVAAGLALGDRPSWLTTIGILLAFPAIYLITRTGDGGAGGGGVLDGILAGAGFGCLFICLGQARPEAGFAPIAVMQFVSITAVIALAVALRQDWRPRRKSALWPLIMGPLGASASAAFLFATHDGLLSVVSVISSLYPATTVLLAAAVLREQIGSAQSAGLIFAGLAVSCVAAG